MIGKLSTITLIVKEMERSVEFYRDVVGLKLQLHTPYWSSMDAKNIIVGLHPESEHSKVALGGGCSFGFEVSDIQKTAEELKAKGVRFLVEPKREDFGWLGVFADPDGYSIVLAQTEAWAKPKAS
jgi:predicted enzyme related to lactoylglutathione lyase